MADLAKPARRVWGYLRLNIRSRPYSRALVTQYRSIFPLLTSSWQNRVSYHHCSNRYIPYPSLDRGMQITLRPPSAAEKIPHKQKYLFHGDKTRSKWNFVSIPRADYTEIFSKNAPFPFCAGTYGRVFARMAVNGIYKTASLAMLIEVSSEPHKINNRNPRNVV